MKKLNIALALIVSSSCAWAQTSITDYREGIYIGIKIGANYSDVYNAEGGHFNPRGKLGFATGLFASLPLTEHIGIQPELLYSEKGFKTSGILFDQSYEFTRTSSYIDIPLFLTLKPNEYFTLLAGPQYSYLLNQKNSFTNASTSIFTERLIDDESVRKHTFCVVGGFDVNISHIVVGARIGIDALRNSPDNNTFIPRHKNLWLQGTIGYRF